MAVAKRASSRLVRPKCTSPGRRHVHAAILTGTATYPPNPTTTSGRKLRTRARACTAPAGARDRSFRLRYVSIRSGTTPAWATRSGSGIDCPSQRQTETIANPPGRRQTTKPAAH